MKPLLFTLFSAGQLYTKISKKLNVDIASVIMHEFPDQETYVKIDVNPKNRVCIIFENLDRPNNKMLPLIFLAETLKDMGAAEVGIITPYLPYMRQDKRFHPGEVIAARCFAKIISSVFDWLITVDPHLHRIHKLDDIYTIPTTTIHATEAIATWIKLHVDKPLLIGPDDESRQWVSEIAMLKGIPFIILEKVRHDATHVEVTIPDMAPYKGCTPVLMDDIIATARTMIETIKHLKKMNTKSPLCIGVHAIFAAHAYDELLAMDVAAIVTCNTIQHASNKIDLTTFIVDAVKHQLNSRR